VTKFVVYERTDEGIAIVAEIDGESVTGPQAEDIEKLLRELGWPAKDADLALHGSRLWAANASNPILPFGG
jgi:hypothetical protein